MKFHFKELDVVRLKQDIPAEKLAAGAIGTIVMKFPEPNEAYEVEFCDEKGKPISVSETIVLLPDQLEKKSDN